MQILKTVLIVSKKKLSFGKVECVGKLSSTRSFREREKYWKGAINCAWQVSITGGNSPVDVEWVMVVVMSELPPSAFYVDAGLLISITWKGMGVAQYIGN